MKRIIHYPNLVQRLITGFLGAGVIVFGVVYSEWTYFLIFATICFLSMKEFYQLTWLDGMLPQKTFGTICGMIIFGLSFFIERGTMSAAYYYLIFPLISCVYMIKLYKKDEKKPFTNVAFTYLGIFYVAVPFALLNVAAYEGEGYNYHIMTGCLLILWASDTGAYFAGTRIGRRKLFERISPKKTWEGAVGGGILALVFAFIIAYYFTSVPLWKWLSIAVIVIVGGTFGDLIESLWKRSIEIKDSGNTLPGHGGFLDRFDGLLISAPFIVAFLELT